MNAFWKRAQPGANTPPAAPPAPAPSFETTLRETVAQYDTSSAAVGAPVVAVPTASPPAPQPAQRQGAVMAVLMIGVVAALALFRPATIDTTAVPSLAQDAPAVAAVATTVAPSVVPTPTVATLNNLMLDREITAFSSPLSSEQAILGRVQPGWTFSAIGQHDAWVQVAFDCNGQAGCPGTIWTPKVEIALNAPLVAALADPVPVPTPVVIVQRVQVEVPVVQMVACTRDNALFWGERANTLGSCQAFSCASQAEADAIAEGELVKMTGKGSGK